MKVRVKKIKTKKNKTARVLKPRVIIPPNRTMKSKKDYNRKKEKDVSSSYKEYET
jgi:hypothetical protein